MGTMEQGKHENKREFLPIALHRMSRTGYYELSQTSATLYYMHVFPFHWDFKKRVQM